MQKIAPHQINSQLGNHIHSLQKWGSSGRVIENERCTKPYLFFPVREDGKLFIMVTDFEQSLSMETVFEEKVDISKAVYRNNNESHGLNRMRVR